MNIQILQGIQGSQAAEGLTVVIDVLRAFSTACYLYQQGAKEVYVVCEIEEALALKHKFPDALLMGERGGRKIPGFDLGNSPIEVLKTDVKNRQIIQTTSAGTKGILNANQAAEIITGSFVNADSIVEYIRKKAPKELSLVAMGEAGIKPTEEDTFCGEYIKAKLNGEILDFESMVEKTKNNSGQRFFLEENQSFSPSADFDLCMKLSIFKFVLQAEKAEGYYFLKKIEM